MTPIKDWPIEYVFFEHRYPVLFLSSSSDELFYIVGVMTRRAYSQGRHSTSVEKC